VGSWLRRLRPWCGALLLLFAVNARPAQANTIVLPSTGEPSLLGPHGILDTLYGLANVTRIDDGVDRLWLDAGVVTATVVAKFAGLDQRLGYVPGASGGAFQALFDVASNCLGPTCGDTASFTLADSGPTFRFVDQAGGVQWSSRPGNNPDSLDHMVSFLITGGSAKGAYVIAFEDLPIGATHDHGTNRHGEHAKGTRGDKKGHEGDDEHHGEGHESDGEGYRGGTSDRDYNDLVVQVDITTPSEVPEPGELGALGTGLFVFGASLRRRAAVARGRGL
jgi:hypothetical protein